MLSYRSIVVSGDLGSGKSTVTAELSRRLGLRRVSVGDLYRQMAQSRGMSALQLNLHAELDDAVDGYVDQLQQEIAKSDEQLVVDGRLAWFFFNEAFKIHLITDPVVAARRVLSRPSDEVEAYSSLAEATERLANRSESERIRFLTRYGADKNRLRNYDLVCDTTRASADEVVDWIIAAYQGSVGAAILSESPPLLLLDPQRIYPSRGIRDRDDLAPVQLAGLAGDGLAALEPLRVGYADHSFYVVDGHRRLSAAIKRGFSLITAMLLAEGDERVADDLTSWQYFESRVSPGVIRDWETAHGITLPPPPRLPESAADEPQAGTGAGLLRARSPRGMSFAPLPRSPADRERGVIRCGQRLAPWGQHRGQCGQCGPSTPTSCRALTSAAPLGKPNR
jgi:predicted cytidylate kinase